MLSGEGAAEVVMHLRRSAYRSGGAAGVALALLVLATGCSGPGSDPHSALSPGGYGAREVAGLWWLMFWTSVAVFVIVVALLLWAVIRRRRVEHPRAGNFMRFILIAGAVVPFLILAGTYGYAMKTTRSITGDVPGSRLTVEVTGHVWWWEVHYPGAGPDVVTANEIHIPVHEKVLVKLRTGDVQHSFWVPSLMPKTDLYPGRVNTTFLLAEKAGRYRGQCAEYCGLQHAHMAFLVVAQPQAEFDAWLARLRQPQPPQTAAQRRGMQAFEQGACASCHTIRGTTANGKVGPDLSNIGSRWSIGAGTVPNDKGYLGGWIANSQTIKPGNKMPPQPVPAADLPDLLAYLESLK